jgi:hypothetical protein
MIRIREIKNPLQKRRANGGGGGMGQYEGRDDSTLKRRINCST